MFRWLGRSQSHGPSAHPSAPFPSPRATRKGPRKLFVHAGLHKTGTTALQTVLSSASDELRQRGVLYPSTGVNKQFGYGHHNIAWQITRDRRFLSAAGTIDDLANEVAQFDGDVILSSEDFESVIDDPECFAPLRLHPALRDREFTLVVYVRNQVTYAESLFLELIHHGMGDEFARFVQPVFYDRKIRLQEWTYQFDYAHIYAQWSTRRDSRLVMRNYHQLDGGSTVADFIDLVCPEVPQHVLDSAYHSNPRRALRDDISRFYQNRVQRPLSRREKETIQHLCFALHNRAILLSEYSREALARSFRALNQLFCTTSGLPSSGLLETVPAPVDALPLEGLFSFELQNLIAENSHKHDIEAFVHGLESTPPARPALYRSSWCEVQRDGDKSGDPCSDVARSV
jgi:hypothetical protein